MNQVQIVAQRPARRVSTVARVAVAGGLLAGAAASQAAVDVADTISDLTAAVTTVSSIGVAALSIVVAVKIFKFVRGAL